MSMALQQETRRATRLAEHLRPWRFHALAAAFAVLLVCQGFMVVDVLADIFYIDLYIPWMDHSTIELIAVIAMTVSLFVLGWVLVDHMRQNRRYRETLRSASGAFLKTISRKFDEWGLSDSEREIALLLIKGLSINEIAQVRNTRPGTIKSQSNAIYRKAGLRGRSELVAYFVEDLLAGEKLLPSRD
ncbi:MAG TPA: LuxR family transcriptional regulator [Thermopetrobacter sp.]|nr:LuxR family transcriptional regulator [Thermopetrobacter sp.]